MFLIGALTFAVLGMAYTALVSNIEQFNILFTGIITPMFLFGGVFFPFSGLPGVGPGRGLVPAAVAPGGRDAATSPWAAPT